jgi:hypothetical protein
MASSGIIDMPLSGFIVSMECFMSPPFEDDRQMDLVEFLETTSPRPFALWADPTTHIMDVVLDADRPVTPRIQRLRAINTAIEAAAEKLPD